MSSTKFGAVTSILLGVAAIILPSLFGTFAVMVLGGVMLASGIVALLYVNAARKEGIPVSVFAPWVQNDRRRGYSDLAWTGIMDSGRHSWRWSYPQRHHRPDGPARLRGSQPACNSQDRVMVEHRTWRAANHFGRRRLRHSARGGPRSRHDQYRPSTVAFGCLGDWPSSTEVYAHSLSPL